MKKKSTSKSGFFKFRVLLGSFVCLAGFLMALGSMGALSGAFAQGKGTQNKGKNWSSTEKFTTSADGQSYHYKSKTKVNTKHFNLSYNPNPTIQSVKFNKSYHINGSQYWKGQSYAAFRGYHPEWHDQGWWRYRYNRVVLISGGWYYWNAGWWYPAWGYAPNAHYAYDGPIYGYNGLTPDQVIANVQGALQQQGLLPGRSRRYARSIHSRSLSQLPRPSRALCDVGDRSSDSRVVGNDVNDGFHPGDQRINIPDR